MSASDVILDRPDEPIARLVLAHGAGAGMDTPWMNEVAQGLASLGISVIRFEFDYMCQCRLSGGRRPPDRMPVLQSRFRDVIDRIGSADGPLMIGGKSMGGRVASLIADECSADGVICLGYPFHPIGKPTRLRTDHLRDIGTPVLILQGERDPFGNRDEVAGYSLAAAVRVNWFEDGDHDLKPRRRSGHTLTNHLRRACEEIAAFASGLVSGL